MAQNPEIKVVLKRTVLPGSKQPEFLQRVATVYINGREYRVSAPPEAFGDALDWLPHLSVRQLVDINSEIEIHDASGVLALKAVKEELERHKQGAAAEQFPPSETAGKAMSSPVPDGTEENFVATRPANKEQLSPKGALDYLTPASFIAAARAADPNFRFALLVAGILGIVVTFARFGVSFVTLVLGAIVLIGLMIMYVVFAQAAKLAKSTMELPAKVLVSTVLVIVIVVLTGLTTSAFFNHPLPIRDWIVQRLGAKLPVDDKKDSSAEGTRARVPLPPVGLRVGTNTVVPFHERTGRILPLSQTVLPCSYGEKTGHGLEGLAKMPGGPQLKEPRLVVEASQFVEEDWSDKDNADLLFEVEVTNRGEASIAKDWSLCLVKPDNQAAYFPSQELKSVYLRAVAPAAESLEQNTFNNPIEHGRAVKGWLLFRVPKDAFNLQQFAGSIACRDYLERRWFLTFETEKNDSLKRSEGAPQ